MEQTTESTVAVSTAVDIIQVFLDAIEVSAKTKETYRYNLHQYFVWLQEQGIAEPSNIDIRNYKQHLEATKKPATVFAYMIAVRRYYEWLADEQGMENIAGKVKAGSSKGRISKEHKKDALTTSQVKKIMQGFNTDTVQGIRDKAIFTLMVCCGLRDCEVVNATVGDKRNIGDTTVLYIKGKGHAEADDFVVLPEQAEQMINDYLATRKGIKDNQPLFCSLSYNNFGGAMTTRAISGIMKEAMLQAGLNSERLTAHSLRHTAITLALINNGGNIQEAQQFARHTNPATTEIYAHNLQKQNNKCSGLVADAIF